MSFMQPQVVFDDWWKVETRDGTFFLPFELVGENPTPTRLHYYLDCPTPPASDAYELINGYGARMSAPGYLDATPWVVFDTENQAREYLKEMHDVED